MRRLRLYVRMGLLVAYIAGWHCNVMQASSAIDSLELPRLPANVFEGVVLAFLNHNFLSSFY